MDHHFWSIFKLSKTFFEKGVFYSNNFYSRHNYIIAVENSFFDTFEGILFFDPKWPDFAKAIAFAWRTFLPIFKLSNFANIKCFLERFFA